MISEIIRITGIIQHTRAVQFIGFGEYLQLLSDPAIIGPRPSCEALGLKSDRVVCGSSCCVLSDPCSPSSVPNTMPEARIMYNKICPNLSILPRGQPPKALPSFLSGWLHAGDDVCPHHSIASYLKRDKIFRGLLKNGVERNMIKAVFP